MTIIYHVDQGKGKAGQWRKKQAYSKGEEGSKSTFLVPDFC